MKRALLVAGTIAGLSALFTAAIVGMVFLFLREFGNLWGAIASFSVATVGMFLVIFIAEYNRAKGDKE